MADEMPKLIAFPVDDIRCRVWCPNCARWHTHSYDPDQEPEWRHRAAHCGTGGRSPNGYLIKLASGEEMPAA